jgi:hypothetical protein
MQFVNDIFEEFAMAFIGKVKGDGEIAFPKKLDRVQLDYSLESLKTLDLYLEHLHKSSRRIGEEEWGTTVLWGGAYLGEVIRRSAKRKYNWIDYDEYMPEHPDLQDLIPERTVGTCAFLCTGKDTMTMPLNKIARFIAEGPENNTHYYASVECKQK